MAKISIIGAGRIGALAAYLIAQRKLADEIILIDINEKLAEGQAYDIMHSLALHNDVRVFSRSYKDVAGSDIVVITCGLAGGSIQKNNGAKSENSRALSDKDNASAYRMQLLNSNLEIIKDVATQLKAHANGAIILTATSPADIMNYFIQKITGFPEEKILGFGNLVDSARLRHNISQKLKCKISEINNAFVVGEHGEAMVPLFSNVTVHGKLHNFSSKEKQEISELVKKAAWTIVNLKGATEFGPATYIADTVEAIHKDTNAVMPVSIVQKNFSIGVLAKIGKNGAEPIEMKMDEEEKRGFEEAVEKVKKILNNVEF